MNSWKPIDRESIASQNLDDNNARNKSNGNGQKWNNLCLSWPEIPSDVCHGSSMLLLFQNGC